MSGYLYVFQEEGTKDFYKVGISENWPDIRKGQLQTGNPRRLIKITYIKLRHYKAVETLIKHRLKHYGTNGGTEWFNCPLNTVLDTVKDCVSEVEYRNTKPLLKLFYSLRLTALSAILKGTKTLMGAVCILAYIWLVFIALALFAMLKGLMTISFTF